MFNSDLEKENFKDLNKISNKIKTYLQKLKLTSSTDSKLIKLCTDLHKVNEFAINHIKSKLKQIHYYPSDNALTENILLFFYINNCEPSKRFLNEWLKLSNMFDKKIKFISLNCENSESKEMCKKFNVYEYPTIKYITPTKIHNYYGELTANAIIENFKLV